MIHDNYDVLKSKRNLIPETIEVNNFFLKVYQLAVDNQINTNKQVLYCC